MPRKNSFERTISSPKPGPTRLRPPRSLSEPERKAFVDLVASCAPDHFTQADMPLIVAYVHATVMEVESARELARGTEADGKWLARWEKATRALTGLSMRLRASPQARMRTAKEPARPMSYYERMAVENGGDAYSG